MSKTLEKYIAKHPEKFVGYHTEMDGCFSNDKPSYWVECREPYFNIFDECTMIHEATVADCLYLMRRVQKGICIDGNWQKSETA